MNTPPVWGIGRDTREAYSVLYEKGALILYDMEQKVGKDLFFGFLKTVSDNKVKTTNELLDLVEMKLSKETRQWLENMLKTA